jgi:YesN/AraC family two-component response regulator
MYGYRLKLPRSLPLPIWACKTSVDRYDWKNRNKPNMIEFSICKASCRTIEIGDQEPITAFGKSFSCILGNSDIKSYAENGVNVEIVSVAVEFDEITYTVEELCERDLKEKDALLLPFMISDLSVQDWMEIEKVIYRFISENVKKDASSKMICASLIYELLAVLDKLVRKDLKANHRKYVNYYVLKAESILAKRYSEKLTLKSVSEELGITPNYLSSLYKSCTGIGFSDRLCELRMKKAEALVLEGSLSVSNIAQAVGFDDESHLRRRFKQYFGIGMKEYRLVNKEQTLYHEKPQRKMQ